MRKREGRKVTLTPPEETMNRQRKCMVIYRTLNLKTKTIDIANEEEIMKAWKHLQSEIFFIQEGAKLEQWK